MSITFLHFSWLEYFWSKLSTLCPFYRGRIEYSNCSVFFFSSTRANVFSSTEISKLAAYCSIRSINMSIMFSFCLPFDLEKGGHKNMKVQDGRFQKIYEKVLDRSYLAKFRRVARIWANFGRSCGSSAQHDFINSMISSWQKESWTIGRYTGRSPRCTLSTISARKNTISLNSRRISFFLSNFFSFKISFSLRGFTIAAKKQRFWYSAYDRRWCYWDNTAIRGE